MFTGDQLSYPNSSNLGLKISVPPGIAAATYPFTVSVVSGPQTKSVDSSLRITDFQIQPPPNSAWVIPGGSGWTSPLVQAMNGFNSVVVFTCSSDVGGDCVGGSFGIGGTSPMPISLKVSVPANATVGVHTLTVTGTVGELSHTFSFPFYVADYSGSLSASSLTVDRGNSGSVNATISATEGFGGTVSLNCTAPAQLSCTIDPLSVRPTAGNPRTSTVRISASFVASARPAGKRTGRPFPLAFALALPLGIIGWSQRGRRRASRMLFGVLAVAAVLAWQSCGGGGTSQPTSGDHGSNTYTVTVNATADGITQRTIGTVNVTVSH